MIGNKRARIEVFEKIVNQEESDDEGARHKRQRRKIETEKEEDPVKIESGSEEEYVPGQSIQPADASEL